ncbi:MAG TPA: 16S rRNA (adenine(1518)-N(6)/adenine(1519)-N(6))-dimethyltransferase RsmA [Candidatus Dormibacteraeota bacterium]|nr:16S rRNA (adenine(1518)-N(6)/adenine(1519)-N(6))-dimethyltransferase RsmA [Candidatus Dormibacteraeota bacterium]
MAPAERGGAATEAGSGLDPAHLGAEAVRRYLRAQGLHARRGLSQNFLVDAEVLEALLAAAAVAPGRRVLEIGPGLGVLTGALLEAGARLTAVELDTRLAALLRRRFGDRLRLIEGDVLDQSLAQLVEAPWDLVANLPYHITSPVLHRVLAAEPRPERLVLMLQREVAERIAAAPGAMSYLSVFVQYHAVVRVARIVPAAAFEPAPQVDSAILVGEARPRRLPPNLEEDLWRLVQAAFRERRKMLHNVLPRQLPRLDGTRLEAALAAVQIDPRRRPQTLAVEEWLALRDALGPLPEPERESGSGAA